MIQLTGKDGDRYFTNKHNEMSPDDKRDFVEQPDLVISDTEYGGVSRLVTRRQKEHDLFLTGVYDFSR